MSRFKKYFSLSKDFKLPDTMESLVLDNAGEENLRLKKIPMPDCGDREILARIDAVIACASDSKLIDQGSRHPLMHGWKISKHPITIGHEGSITIVEVGRRLKNVYHLGERCAVQPAIPLGPKYHKERYRNMGEGINKIAIGYTLPGLFSEYVLIPEEVIKSGCIIPFPKGTIPYFGAALAEPISDVIASQERMIHFTKETPTSSKRPIIGPLKGGVTLIIGAGPMGSIHLELALSHKPRKIIVSEMLDERRVRAKKIFQRKGEVFGVRIIFTDPDNLIEVLEEETGKKGVDDVIVALGNAKVQEKSLSYLAQGGVLNLFGGTRFDERIIEVDTHRIHYDGVTIVGSSGSDSSDISKALQLISKRIIDPGNFIVKCGGLDSALTLMKAVKQRKIHGKGVIYPHTRSRLFDVEEWDTTKEKMYLDKNLCI